MIPKLTSRRAGALAWPLALALAGLALLGIAWSAPVQEGVDSASVRETRAVTVLLVRHAEKASDDARDPSLSEAGTARALELARALRVAGVTHLYSTAYKRTRATLAPLAVDLELEIEDYDPRDPSALVETLAGLPGGAVALVSGHSNTTPGLYAALGGDAQELVDSPHGRLIAEDSYDRLYLVTISRDAKGALTTHASLELRYGD